MTTVAEEPPAEVWTTTAPPMFAPTTMPRHRASDDPAMDPVTSPTAEDDAASPDRDASGTTRRGLAGIRTRISDGTGDPRSAGALVAGLAGLAAMLAGWLVSRRDGIELRKPTKSQLADFGDPLGRVLARRFDMALLGPDLADVIEAGAATGAYLTDGPLTRPHRIAANLPDHDEETDQ